jgi:hypothetical protein
MGMTRFGSNATSRWIMPDEESSVAGGEPFVLPVLFFCILTSSFYEILDKKAALVTSHEVHLWRPG